VDFVGVCNHKDNKNKQVPCKKTSAMHIKEEVREDSYMLHVILAACLIT
jgi:hypothetical protein